MNQVRGKMLKSRVRVHNPKTHKDMRLAQRNTKNHRKGQFIGLWKVDKRKNKKVIEVEDIEYTDLTESCNEKERLE
jgi:hypothetical protein